MPSDHIDPNSSSTGFSSISDGFIRPFMEKGEYGTWLREDHALHHRGSGTALEHEMTMAEAVENINPDPNRRGAIVVLPELGQIEAEAVALFDAQEEGHVKLDSSTI